MNEQKIKFAYFGGEPLGVPVLEALRQAGLLPSLIVSNPDRPVGRKQTLTPPPVKVWAELNNVEVWQPQTIPKTPSDLGRITSEEWDVFIVVAYNKILPEWFIELPKHKTLNVHPSLLPKLRGASPIRSTILNDMRTECGVSVMLLDEHMDHGPIIAQERMEIPQEVWPVSGTELDEALARLGGAVLADILPQWVAGLLKSEEQDHEAATYCGKMTKDMAELTIDPYHLPKGALAYEQLLKIRAFDGWPVAFFIHEGKRYKITAATIGDEGKLQIDRVIPEGKNETDFKAIFR